MQDKRVAQGATTRAKAVKALAGVIKADVHLLEQGREQGMVLAAISAALKVQPHPVRVGGVGHELQSRGIALQ